MRRLYAIQIEYVVPPPQSMLVVVWPFEPESKFSIARPVDRNQSWLDVEAGHEVYVKGKRMTVKVVRLYRGHGGDEFGRMGDPIKSGRAWMCAPQGAT